MNRRLIGVLLFALLISGAASFGVYRLVVSKVSGTAKSVPASTLLVAAHNLNRGTMVKEEDLTAVAWPMAVPVNALNKKEDIVGRGVMDNIYAQEPMLESRLAAKGAGAGFAASIPSGMRAVAVHVNEVVGVAGFAVPGMHVDVLITGNPPGNQNTQGTMVRTLLQDIEVLSAGQDFKKDAEGKPVTVQVVNLLVDPRQAEILSLASNEAKIQLVLRNPVDNKIATTHGAALGSLFSGTSDAPARKSGAVVAVAAPPVKAAPPPEFVMEIISGNKRTRATFAEVSQ